jgi:hypothetical protein
MTFDPYTAFVFGCVAVTAFCAGFCWGIWWINQKLYAQRQELREEMNAIAAERGAMITTIAEFERLFLRGNHGSRPVRTQILDAGVHRHH